MIMEKRTYICSNVLEQMNVEELSDLMVRASTILNQKLQHTEEPIGNEGINDLKSTSDDFGEKVSPAMETNDDGTVGDTFQEDIPMLDSLLADKPESTGEVLKVKLLDPIDLTGIPDNELEQIGNEIEATSKSPNRQGGRIYSVYGVCPTITKTAPPKVLVCNEINTSVNPEVIEVELIERNPNPLW